MPYSPPTISHVSLGDTAQRKREHEARRGSARARGYDSRWDRASKAKRRDDPLCAYCALDDKVTAAQVVDHLYPHRVYDGTFWVKRFWVSSCKACHDGFKQAIERRGKAAIDALARRLGIEPL